MSYEGYNEWLCQRGHYHTTDCYETDPLVCPICNSLMAYHHAIDLTNGADDDNPDTMPAPTAEDGYDDIWKEDHYGNKYAEKRLLHKPASSDWKPLGVPGVAKLAKELEEAKKCWARDVKGFTEALHAARSQLVTLGGNGEADKIQAAVLARIDRCLLGPE